MKKVISLIFLFAVLSVGATVFAAPPEEVEVYFNYLPTGCLDERWASDNYFGRECHDTGEYGYLLDDPDTHYGDFIGDSTEVYEITLHGADPLSPNPLFAPYRMAWYKGIVEFEGTVLGSDEGTMWIKYIGKSPENIFVWSGTWRILGGVDGLEGIHGGGTWESCPPDGDFIACLEGKVHFN